MSKLFSLFGKRKKERPQPEEIPTACPYCGEVLPKRPTRKSKCPFCKKVIYVRTDPDTREKVITTEEGVREIDARWERKRWLRELSSYEITERDFDSEKERLAKQFGKEPSNRDVVWGLFNSLAKRQPSASLYYQMALFLEEEERDFIPVLQQSRKMDLLHWKEMGITKVEIHTAGDKSCPSCQLLQGKVYKIGDALKEMPIPNKECTTCWHHPNQGFCRCIYVASFND